MVKYETKFKLEVVESFLAGEGGAKPLARRWSVSEEKVRSWVSRYRLHGPPGLPHPRAGEVRRAHSPSPNLLDRQFEAERPNQKWVTDVTEFNVRGDKLYLSPIMDLYNGEIVAYETHERPLFCLVGNMLKKALAKVNRRGAAPLLHSDQGWHYQMPAYRKQLSDSGLTQGMSRKGNYLDNAATLMTTTINASSSN
jgi:transposase InsO family protein